MRKGRRKVLAILGMFLLGTLGAAAPPDPAAGGLSETPVRLTVEMSWTFPADAPPLPGEGTTLGLTMSEGKVVEALTWPVKGDRAIQPARAADGEWRMSTASSGRVRARIEAPLGAAFVFRAGGQDLRIPLTSLLEGRQHTPPQAPVAITLERLPWDSLTLQTRSAGPDDEVTDGTVVPGARVAIGTGLNILTPEPAEMMVHCVAELRPLHGGDAVWRAERQEIVPTNRVEIPNRPWLLTAPRVEGTYVLEVRAAWESVVPREGSRFSRLIRRLRTPPPGGSATRRLTLTVLKPDASAKESAHGSKSEHEIDAVDLTRRRGSRVLATGRAPLAQDAGWDVPESVLVEPTRRDRLRGWLPWNGADTANLGPPDGAGLAWSALGLKVTHPGRAHRLTVKVTGGQPAALGVALLDPGGPGKRPRVALDVCASGPPILPDGAPQTFSWLVWPDAAEPVLMLVNRANGEPVQVGGVTLTELGEVPAGPSVTEPESRPRGLGLYVADFDALERFGASDETAPADMLAISQRLARYLAYCGATSVVVPEELADRAGRQALHGQAAEDALGPDRLDLLLRVLDRRDVTAWLELDLTGPLPGLPAADSPEALERGLVRIDRQGQADGNDYHPLHPDVRAALRRRVLEGFAAHRGTKCVQGLLVRLGPGPTLLGAPATGLDDSTYTRFAREMFDQMAGQNVPALGTDDPNRFAQRATFLMGPARTPWLTWRAREIAALYGDLAAAVREVLPAAVLAVATPGLDDSPAGAEARQADLAGLAPTLAWRSVGLDLDVWPTGRDAPLVLRGVDTADDGLARDLALSTELDAKVIACPHRGLLLASSSPLPATPRARGAGLRLWAQAVDEEAVVDEPLGHALAALDARLVLMSTAALAGHEQRIRRFAQVYRALPAPEAGGPAADRHPSGVAVRAVPAGQSTYVALANDTPYPILVEALLPPLGNATVDDLGRGLRLAPKTERGESHLVLELAPFGVSAVRVGAPAVAVNAVVTYPSAAVKAAMLAQYNALSALLARLNQGAGDASGPPNPGFEPHAERGVVPLNHKTGPLPLDGWQLVEGMGMPGANTADIDPAHAHSGQGSLRLSASAPPASVVSAPFAPGAATSLTISAWFRASPPDARLRLWIEGEAGGQPFLRRTELTIQPEWGAQAVRASSLPAGGLESARLRFELLSPGTVWVDEVNVAGELLTDTERAYARRALVAAIVAHRENRYADFARLAGSHWARRPAALWGDPAAVARGGANALPSDRRLR